MIVFPMAGRSSRFLSAGYSQPKYRLPLWERTVFEYAVLGFEASFANIPFLFALRGGVDDVQFLKDRLRGLGLSNYEIAVLDQETQGQAETVELALHAFDFSRETALTIFNIDTFRPNFRYPSFLAEPSVAGYLEVFRGFGDNWSFVCPKDSTSNSVARTSEKIPISDLCCTGLYHFSRVDDFLKALEAERQTPQAKELYVAPLYNHLIRGGQDIRYDLIEVDSVIFCGVPREYEALKCLDRSSEFWKC